MGTHVVGFVGAMVAVDDAAFVILHVVLVFEAVLRTYPAGFFRCQKASIHTY